MIIKCLAIYSDGEEKYIQRDSFLTIGKLYHVLEIYCLGEDVRYRVISDDASSDAYTGAITHPILVRAQDFEIVSNTLPGNWGVKVTNTNRHRFGPEKWINNDYWEHSFWEDFGNSVLEALQCYKDELKVIMSTDSLDDF